VTDTITILVKVMSVVYYAPSFLLPAIAVALVGGWLGNIYIKAQLSVKREMSNAKAPVLGILGSSIAGLSKWDVLVHGRMLSKGLNFQRPLGLIWLNRASRRRCYTG
jgi:hypothetical protein